MEAYSRENIGSQKRISLQLYRFGSHDVYKVYLEMYKILAKMSNTLSPIGKEPFNLKASILINMVLMRKSNGGTCTEYL